MLQIRLTKWTSEKIESALELLSLSKRASVNKAPVGYEQADIYPWKYNRALSYLRKPLVRIEKQNEVMYYWGFRHVYSSSEHLQYLLYSGRLKAKDGGLLGKYLAKVNAVKGKVYRDLAAKWFTSNTPLKVIPYEVKISPAGHLTADKDYGDIDLLAIDEQQKIIYSVECKNTVSARVIHEMKTELDKYLGRNGENGMIEKHVERDKWLKANSAQFSQFVVNPQEYRIRSLVLTYDDIPTVYL